MIDDATSGDSAALPRCMWCSAELPSDHETVCPSCKATLVGDGDAAAALPGVTAIDAEALLRAARTTKPGSRSRLMSWISGDDYEVAEKPSAPGSLAPPPLEVRREMLRLEIEAEVANLQAEASALAAEEAVETGTSIAETDIGAALAAVNAAAAKEAAGGPAAAAADEAAADEVTADATPVDETAHDEPPPA